VRFGRAVATVAFLVGLLGASSGPRTALGADGRLEGSQAHLDHPTWLLPAWTADGPAVWTEVGAPYAASVALIAPDGSFAPRNHGPAVSFWLYDTDAAGLLVPAEHSPRLRLDDDYLPIVTNIWDAADLHIETTYFTGLPGGNPASWFQDHGAGSDRAVTYIRTTVTSSSATPRHLALFAALRPFGVERDVHPLKNASCEVGTGSLFANGAVVLTSTRAATQCGATSISTDDASAFAQHNEVPRTLMVSDPAERAESVLRLEVTAQSGAPGTVEFRAPTGGVEPTPEHLAALISDSFEQQRALVATSWRAALTRTTFDVSDARFGNAFRASQAYLLLNRRGAAPRSGPLAHDAFWVRDAAYLGQAMERVGYAAENQATLEALIATQRDDGSFPAITDATVARSVDEWDAQGEAIAALVAHYRFGHDLTWLARVYPSVASAARFLDALRGRTLSEDPETRSLLPANLSAEDLGSASWHHYWDDLWAIAGYREAAFAASETGQTTDAIDFEARADDLQRSMLESVSMVQARTGASFVPNGPEDVQSSSMARGTTPALWPIRSLRGGLESFELLSESFRAYYRMWITPQSGGYSHYLGTLWPYGGLGIAHAALRLGMLESTWQVLAWTMSHQTLPGTYAWGEAINPQTGGLELGDMPHSWAAAELISLLRDLVISEQDGVLLVNPGTPDTWLDPGKHIVLKNAPTEYGLVNVSLSRVPQTPGSGPPDLTVQLDGTPPRGWLIRVPGNPVQVSLDGSLNSLRTDGQIPVPTGPHVVVVRYVAPPSRALRSWLQWGRHLNHQSTYAT
jgi:hypothetical protein